MPSNFKNFISTLLPPIPRHFRSTDMLLTDPTTGAPVGIQNQGSSGPDAMFTPLDLTAAQIAAPTPAIVADLNSTFRLNVAPYTRYQSDGSTLTAIGAQQSEILVPAGVSELWYSPLTISPPETLVVQGTLTVRSLPA